MTRSLIAPAGLKGVVFADTSIGDVLGDEGAFHYRGIDAVALAESTSLEDAWHLVLLGTLPDEAASAAFRERVGAARAGVDGATLELVRRMAAEAGPDADPLHLLQLALARASIDDPAMLDASAEDRVDRVLAVAAQTPTLLAAAHRAAHGLPPLDADPAAGHVADWLRLATGSAEPHAVRALETYLVATIDHGSNASTFAARVVASTGASVSSSMLAAVGAFLGPLHGGAPSRALATILRLEPDAAAAWVRATLERGDRVMGFGHAVYRTRDPRSELLRGVVAAFDDPLVARATALEQRIEEALAEAKPGRHLHANVEFYAGLLMHLVGLAPTTFTATFAVARVAGWGAHVLEQASLGRIIRPSMRYVGD